MMCILFSVDASFLITLKILFHIIYHQQKQVEERLCRTKQKGLGLIHYRSQREF